MSAPIDPTAVIHATAVVDAGALVGPGTRIWHFSHVMAGARIGAGCVLGQNVFVAGTVVMGDGCRIQNNVSLYDGVLLDQEVFIGPSVVFTNVTRPRAFISRKKEFRATRVARGASIGANATIVCGRVLGAYCFVAAGAVVTRDVPAHALVAGVPARMRGWVCRCGEALRPSDDAIAEEAEDNVRARQWGCASCGTRYHLLSPGAHAGGVVGVGETSAEPRLVLSSG